MNCLLMGLSKFSVNNYFFKNINLKKKNILVNKNFLIVNLRANIKKKFKVFKFNNNYISHFILKNKKILKIFEFSHKKLDRKGLFMYCSFCYSKIFLKVGLGFRKKYFKKFGCYLLNIGLRKWAIFKTSPSTFFFNIKRRNIFIFSNSKKKLYFFITHLKYLKKETVYKVKGVMTLNRIIFNKKISRSILFARRVKFKAIKLKLTKKQKQRR